jgi:SAM-dependent methyltransferase
VHWWSFSPRVIMKMLERLGFEVVEFDRHIPSRMNAGTKLFTVVGRRRGRGKVTYNPEGPSQIATPRSAAAAIPLPPAEARFLVSGTEQISEFALLGHAGFQALSNSLGKAGILVEDAGRVLDFGCGVGRVLRYWADYPKTEIHGCDYQQDAIEWCTENIPFGHFAVNKLWPDLPYSDGTFDVIYALSVFTHLPESAQLPWLAELSRILKPGGVIYFSVHGTYYEHLLDPEKQARFASGQVIVTGEDQPGTNICAAFHPPQYVKREFIENCGFSLLEHVECGALGNPRQDSYLIRKTIRRTNAA